MKTKTYNGVQDKKYFAKQTLETIPFETAEEAWFWFISAQAAKNDGARYVSGAGLYPRPCEPVDILKALDTLYRNRRLQRDHLLVLRHYGRRQMPPDPDRIKEHRAYKLWCEALERIEEILIRKGIVERYEPACAVWEQGLIQFEGIAAE